MSDKLLLLPITRTKQIVVIVCLGIFALVQLTVPLRHLAYPGEVQWTEEGHRFSWRMKLNDKDARTRFQIKIPSLNSDETIHPRTFLSKRQYKKMSARPDMILQAAHFLRDKYRLEKGANDVEVYALTVASLNNHPKQRLIDSEVNLAAVKRTLGHATWIIPFGKDPIATLLNEPGEKQNTDTPMDDEEID